MSEPLPPLRDLTDADLARRIAGARRVPASAEEAELCRRYGRRLFFFGLRHLRADDRARDLAQQSLVVTLEKLRAGEVREPDRIGAFILGVARHLSRARHRDGVRHQPLEAAPPASLEIHCTPPDPLARGHVARCLEALHDRQRTVIVLTYYAEQSTDVIATSLGLTANHVRVLRHRAIGRLRTCLGLEAEGAAA